MPPEGQSRRDALVAAGLAPALLLPLGSPALAADADRKPRGPGQEKEDAVRQITDIERAYGFSDIGQFTAPPPPRIV